MAKVSVIIPAAGAGKRFGGSKNKIFQDLSGRAVFLRILDIFAARKDVCQIQLVLSATDIHTVREQYTAEIESLNVTLAEGGPTRADSVRNALSNLSQETELVCIHDAVRPCITQASIDKVIEVATQTGAAILATPVNATLKKISADQLIEQTISREGLWEAQTPQVFSKNLILQAYKADVAGVTDDAQLVEAAGHAVAVVPGDPRNIKITTQADLVLAEAIFQAMGK